MAVIQAGDPPQLIRDRLAGRLSVDVDQDRIRLRRIEVCAA